MTGYRLRSSAAMTASVLALALLSCDGPVFRSAARADEPSGLAIAGAIEEAMAAAIARAEKSVVSIARVADKGNQAADIQPDFLGRPRLGFPQGPHDPDFIPTGFATGVVVGKRLVVTNHHVLALGEPSRFYITTPSRKVYAAIIKGADSYSDLAVLEVVEPDSDDDFAPITFGDGGALRKGQFVVALGNPYAIARDGQASASWGIVSNLQRKAAPQPGDNGLQPTRPTLQHFGSLIQTDVKLNLGASGGALVNLKGEMVGLTTSLAAVAGYEQAAGYAIPVDEAFRETIAKLKNGEERTHGLLGITFHREEGIPASGVRVDAIYDAGPAGQAGIRKNDIITRIDDRPIRDGDDLLLSIGRLSAGRRARVTIERDGRVIERQVTLAKFPVPGATVVTNPTPSWRGMTVDYGTVLLEFPARAIAADGPRSPCVIVREVVEGSPAWEAGLRRGMLIDHVGAASVETPDEFREAVAGKEGDVVLRLAAGTAKQDKITVPAQP